MQSVEKNLATDPPRDLRIIKLGGSLFTHAQLPALFDAWIADQPLAFNLIVAGGGEVVEAIRVLDQLHHLNQAFAHWLCVDLMHQTAALAHHILNYNPLLQTPEELNRWNQGRMSWNLEAQSSIQAAVVSPRAYYTIELSSESSLPLSESWNTTSDSIAAWLAKQLDAQEVVLLKSPNAIPNHNEVEYRAPSPFELESLAARGLVDGSFPSIAAGLPRVRIACLAPRG